MAEWVRRELRGYIDAASPPTVQTLPTRCSPWTVRALTAHLAVTFQRFADMLARSRTGDLSPPFAPHEITEINLREVELFAGDPFEQLQVQAERFLSMASDPGEVMAHQRGPIPVGLQMRFALNELVLHRHDVEEARGGGYRPEQPVIQELLRMWEEVRGGLPPSGDSWHRILAASGR
jgi:uncharacterized protein (TIGR03083 family)